MNLLGEPGEDKEAKQGNPDESNREPVRVLGALKHLDTEETTATTGLSPLLIAGDNTILMNRHRFSRLPLHQASIGEYKPWTYK